jgi:two-component system, NarL family, response regulator LiaR
MEAVSPRTRTLIVESQILFAKALAQILTMDAALEVVGDTCTLTEATVRSLRPNLILIDIDGNDADLVETIRATRAVLPDVRICALSMRVQPEVMQRCLTAGADGYLVKDVTPNEFLRAIKSVAAGESYVDPRIAGRLLRRRSVPNRYPDPCDLSARETEVVRLIVAGMSNKEISAKLNLSEKTIKNHVSRIFSKFDCTARTQAAVFAIRSGLA